MPNSTPADLFLSEVKDLYDAEKQLLRALPRVAKNAANKELANAFRTHVEETRGQIGRLEQIFEHLGQRAKSKPCKGMKGLLEEGQEVMEEEGREEVTDCAIAGAGRKVEHYEMAGYTAAQEMAKALGMKEVAQLLAETLEEEKEMDRRLKALSSQLIKEAKTAGMGMEEEEGQGQSRGRGRGKSASSSASANSGRNGKNGKSASMAGRSSSAGRKGSNGRKAASGRGAGNKLSHMLTDHEEIKQWAEERGAHPACVKGTGRKKNDTGMIRLDFPGFSGEESLQEIDWDQFFEQFDENNLALVVQDKTSGGERSNFNKLVRRQ